MTTTTEQRKIINISLPPAVAKEVREEVASGGYASVSEYFRHLLREHKKARLAEELRRDRVEFGRGKGKRLTSLRSLR